MRIYLLLIFYFISYVSLAQTTVLKGKIIDSNDSFSLPGASLRLQEGNRHTVSDANGNFEFLNLPDGTYTLNVDYMGYNHFEQKITTSDKGIEVRLVPASSAIDEVQVIGDIAKGQARALNQQKSNNNISNIISSDQVGRFPDQNIGDALKRIPGITMQNDQGEARNIIVRGLSPELNSVTLNGDRIPSAEGDNRNVQMDLIPSDMISSIEVNKTLTPDMDADAIGGSVNLITRAAPNKQRISATLSGGYAPIREKAIYNASLIYGNRFMDNKMGLVLSGTIQTNDFGSNNIEAEWDEDEGDVFLKELQIRKYDVTRVRRSVSAAWDYDIDAKNRLALNAMYNWRDDRENRFATTFSDIEYDAEADTYIGEIEHETKGGVDNSRNKGRRLERQSVMNFSLQGEHILLPTLDMDWAASYSRASEWRPNERYISYVQEGAMLNTDFSDPYLPFASDQANDLSSFELNELTENENNTHEDEFGAKLNFRVPLSVIDGQKGRIRFGVRLRMKTKERDNNFFEYSPLSGFDNMAELPIQTWNAKGWDQGERYAAGSFVDKNFLGGLNLADRSQFERESNPKEFLSQNYRAKEQIYAGYVRWDQNITESTALILGARLEHTRIDYTGNNVVDEEELAGEINNKNDYTQILPGITLKHNFSKNLVLRAAVTTSLARPNYYALAPYVNSNLGDKELFAGNPNLEATYSTNYDLMLERYFQNVGIISGGAFYKRLKNFIYMYNDRSFTADRFDQVFPTLENPIDGGDTWDFAQYRNGEKVDVYGFEVAIQRQLDFLPGPFLQGFAVYANYTYTKSKAEGIAGEDGVLREGLGLPQTAPHMVNGSLSWENSKFSARVSANYTAAYLDEIGDDAFTDAFYDKQFFLDANASYKIRKSLRIFAEANNLTNQPLRYYQGEVERMRQLEYYKPRYTLGLKFDL
ncbi:TonB-dependent receptor [Sphingobacterium sp. JB170]|uniref:TonB-dependent receptor n=1 Tax=Sphingobacterium sp. JB170 TaxID=1434842 RepID=UPI00097F5767|nr:TonB-dependent receptor [Sphingobacterium sp. JB170]SJN47790.1 TonB-dependent receptor [Sphingobacterium sp. JB170]